MPGKCPGQDLNKLRVALYKCQNCGTEVEMFSDELRVKCHKCGQYIYQETMPTCISWCAQARQCLGEERWQQLKSESMPEEKSVNTTKEVAK